ncbi:MAG: OmpA family protein [Actinomycetota bacterium]|nr:OmpA family protein [Actinomycetota bacterium]
MGTRKVWLIGTAMVMALASACGGGSSESSDSTAGTEATTETTTTPVTDTPDSTLPPGVTPGLDDLNDDGLPDPICGTGEYGAGLVLQIPCNAPDYAPSAPEGTTVIPDSVYALPGLTQREVLADASADAIQAHDPTGKRVVVFFIQSDTLFELGSATLSNPAQDTLNRLARAIQAYWPTATMQVRGHTDATGSASVNQSLSEQRAANVAAYLATQGINQSRLSSIGMASTRPIVLETNPDGSDNPAGRTVNRRVELVVRVP